MHPAIFATLRAVRWLALETSKVFWNLVKWGGKEIASAASEPVKRFYKKHRLLIWLVGITLILTAIDVQLGFSIVALWGLAIGAKIIIFGFAKPKKKKKRR